MTEEVSPAGSEIAFALTGDTGTFAEKTLALVRSLRDHYPDSAVLVFLPGESASEMRDGIATELRETTTIRTGEFPIEDYPHTAFQRAWELAVEEFPNAEYYAAIDSDAVVLNPLTLPRPGADLYATGMYMGGWSWQAVDGITDDWHALFDHYDIPEPTETGDGLTDDYPMWPPYYNSGVLVTTDDSIPSRFLKMNRDLFGGELTEVDPAIETEQVASALLAADPCVDFVEMGPRQNWMMGGFRSVPRNVEVLHYQYFDTLSTLRNSRHVKKLEQYGVDLDPRWSDYAARALSYVVFRSGKVLRHRYYVRFSDDIVQPFLDWNNPED